MNTKLKKTILKILKLFIQLFYKKQYLQGRYFDYSFVGFRWALSGIFYQKILGRNRHIPWPITPLSTISNSKNIFFHIDDLNNFQSPGCYYQNFSAKIIIGKGTYIAPNVGIITANHDLKNLDSHSEGKDVLIGDSCWIGMSSVILPGVVLGNSTIVGAGSVVTKSFINGNCVIAGNPAKIIKMI